MHGLEPKYESVLGDKNDDGRMREVPVAVVEQRVSNLAQGSLCLVLLTKPFLHVLNLVPQGIRSDPLGVSSVLTPSHDRRACGFVVRRSPLRAFRT